MSQKNDAQKSIVKLDIRELRIRKMETSSISFSTEISKVMTSPLFSIPNENKLVQNVFKVYCSAIRIVPISSCIEQKIFSRNILSISASSF